MSKPTTGSNFFANARATGKPTYPRPITANPRSIKSRSIHVVILLVPLDKSRQPDLDRRLRLEAEIAARGLDVGEAFRHVAGLQRQELLLRGAAEQPFEDADKV